jgi:DNA-binding NarL/FixJ family response regulator
MVGVAVVADIPLYREGLAQALDHREGIHVVGTAPSSQDGLEAMADLDPDIALVDVATTDGLAAVRLVVDAVPHAKVVALALHDSEDDVIAFPSSGPAAGHCRDRNGFRFVAHA